MEEPVPLDRWVEQLTRFSLIRVRLAVEVLRATALREPACVQVRGQLGALFREQRCLTGATDCAGCPSKQDCDFARVFDAEGSSRQTPAYWLQGIPAHTVLEAQTSGEPTLWMLEKEASTAPFLGEALRRALLALGRPANTPRWEPILRASPVRLERLSFPQGEPSRCWTIRAETPLDLRTDDKGRHHTTCPEAPEFSMLVDAGVRRLHRLAQEALPGVPLPQLQRPDLTTIRRLHGGFEEVRNRRFSHRQLQAMPLQGFVGELRLEGDALQDLSPLLHLLPTLSVGKKTTMGFGWVDAQPS